MSASPFTSTDNYKQIVRGCLYWAVAPFQAEDPVTVFHPHPKSPTVGITGPDPGIFDSGREHPAVIRFKKRPVLVVQADSVNRKTTYEYTVVALGQSFKDAEIGGRLYNAIRAVTLPNFTYIPKGVINEREGYLSLSNLLMLHKSMLLERITLTSPFEFEERARINQVISDLLGLTSLGLPRPKSD